MLASHCKRDWCKAEASKKFRSKFFKWKFYFNLSINLCCKITPRKFKNDSKRWVIFFERIRARIFLTMHSKMKWIKFLKANITKVNTEWRCSPTHNNNSLLELVYLPFQIELLADVFPRAIAAAHIPKILSQKAVLFKPYFTGQTQGFLTPSFLWGLFVLKWSLKFRKRSIFFLG